MRRIVAALALALFLAAGFEAARSGEKRPPAEQRYVMVTMITAHPFWNDIKKGAQDAADQLGVKFEFTGPVEWDAAAQANQLEQLIVTRPAGFIVGSYDPSMTAAINRCVAAGIPVVTFDSDAPESRRMTFIGPDHYKLGREYGKYMSGLLNGKGDIGLLTVPAQTNLNERIRGITDYCKEYAPEVKVVAIEDNGGNDQITAEKAKSMLQGHPGMAGVIVCNATGSGVAAALKELGKVGKVKVLTSDVSDPILKGIMDGAIDATSYVNIYLEGYYSLRLLYDYYNGLTDKVPGMAQGVNKLPENVDPGLFFITSDTAGAFFSAR
ncbi:MAG: substrate-binding domain-containing protein [Planctomycetota bacterium]|jgi:ribose transport system substrate-binding protein|nr:substrate-binding domain-containing protein [Planctomycetota bacterium]